MSDNRAPVGQTIDKWYKCSICICKYFFFEPHVLLIWYEKNKDSFKQVVQLYPTGWQFETLSGSHFFFFTCMSVSTKAKYSSYILHILLTTKLKVNPRRLNTQALDVNILWVHAWLWALRTICTTELLNLADFGKWERVNQNN